MDLRLASRQSDLARLQAYQVGDALKNKNTQLNIHFHFRESLGDINQDDPLWKMPEKGVFTEDFRAGLIEGHWDMVVHSWKDLPVEQESETEIVATLPRADMRDLFLLKKSHLKKVKETKKLNVFSSSPRRIYNLTPFFKDYFPANLESIQFESVRGNILTRVRKLIENDEIDGLIVAKAAIDRLLSVERDEFVPGQKELSSYLQKCLWQVLPLSKNPTAAAQGALAVEIASHRDDLKKVLSSIHCQETWEAVQEERKILKSHGGGCHQKIGVSQLVRDYGKITFLRGETEQSEILDSIDLSGDEIKLTRPFNKDGDWFEREPLDYQLPECYNAHYVSRSSALPKSFEIDSSHILWVSGLKTWRKLAQRGYWVHGSSESLGEREDERLGSLHVDAKWIKWTHDQSPKLKNNKAHVSTYQLKPKVNLPEMNSFQEFYWMSGSQFKLAVENSPELLHKDHFCGPGNSYSMISRILEQHNINKKPRILPNYQLWQKATKGL